MATVWIFLIAVLTFFITISLVVIGQETHPVVSILLFAAVIFAAVKLFQARITRL